TVLPFRHREAIGDPLSELAREGARRMLAQVLIAEADSFVARWKNFEIAGWPRPCRAPWPWAVSGNPNRGGPCRGRSRQGTRPGRRGRRGQNPLHFVDPAEVGAADEEPQCAVAGSLPAWGFDWRLPGSPRRLLGQRRAEPVAGGDLAADSRMAGRLRRLAEARPLGEALPGRVGGRGLSAGPNGRSRRMHAGADRRNTRGQEGTRRLPNRGT